MHSYKFILLGGVGTYPCYKTKECGNLIVVLVQFKQYETASLHSSGFFVILIHRGIKKAIAVFWIFFLRERGKKCIWSWLLEKLCKTI